ncbi:MAG: hypothetical protein KAX36_06910, partial [Thermoflexales bacterium]|nr:hypothetical protein [Thermoflexales bacterium]
NAETDCVSGANPIQAYPANASLIPNNPLSAFDGESIAGGWRFTASDNVGSDTGTLISWCLAAVSAPAPTDTPTPTATPTSLPTDTPTVTPTDTPTATPTNTATPTPTVTPSNTPTATPTATPTTTPTATPKPTYYSYLPFVLR